MIDLDDAIISWLDAREACIIHTGCSHESTCVGKLELATAFLYTAFSEGYININRAGDDFCTFQKLLVQQYLAHHYDKVKSPILVPIGYA